MGKKEKKIANRNREFIVNELGQGANAVAEARAVAGESKRIPGLR